MIPRQNFLRADDGQATVEYAIVALAAAALAALLFSVVTGDAVFDALTDLIHDAFSTDLR